MQEHVFLVAVTVEGPDRETAERSLHARLPQVELTAAIPVTSWWIAEDDRQDGSDNDSGVFVHPGSQAAAHKILREAGLTN